MTKSEFICFLMLNGMPKEKAEEFAKYFDFTRLKGKWIDGGMVRKIGGYSADCSVCGEWSEYLTNFCGNCGADMRGEE